MYLLYPDFVGVIWSDLIDGAGNKSKQYPSSQPDPLFLNPDSCADVHDITYSNRAPPISNIVILAKRFLLM